MNVITPTNPVDPIPSAEPAPDPAPDPAPAGASPGRLALPADRPLRAALLEAFDAVLAHAADAAGEVDRDPVDAVHRYRKSLRRARSLLSLLSPALAAEQARSIGAVLRSAHRATSDLRDADVVRSSLAGLADRRRWADAMAPVAAALPSDPESDVAHARAVLSLGVEMTAALPRQLDEALPAEVGWDEVTEGLRQSYRRARRALRVHRDTGAEPDLHRWRKRSKEVTYQLELLAAGGKGRAAKLRKRLAALGETLGAATDLMILREHLAASRGDDPADSAAGAKLDKKLSKKLARRIERRVERAVRDGRDLYAERPRVFAERVTRRPRKAAGAPPPA